MWLRLLSIFVDVVVPVFAIVGLAYALGPRLQLDVRTLSRAAYSLFVPAFTFDVISRASVPPAHAVRMAAFIAVAHLLPAAIAWVFARAIGRSREMTAALVMLAVFGNVGNFGLALVQFRLGDAAVAPATIYFIATLVTSFVVCVGMAAWVRGGGASAAWQVAKTPALIVVIPALALSASGIAPPVVVQRTVGLLGDAMIPVMLVVLGLQLRETPITRLSTDVLFASGLRLAVGPALAAVLAPLFSLTGVDRGAGILQAGMPAAVLVSIIAVEYRVAPAFVMTAVFFSTVCSLATLTVVMALI
ncbi:MAG TPA: AEC family transporter [Anaeromyxobacteraceae bacterium]|nr:AEC family transporter [Anaeromyxobacteraceae bacterium]